MQPESEARELSRAMRDYLIDHVKAPRPIDRAREGRRFQTRTSMVARGLVRLGSASPAAHGNYAASHTHITPRGRAVVAFLLGEYAEILVRLGYGIAAPPESRLARHYRAARQTDGPQTKASRRNGTARDTPA